MSSRALVACFGLLTVVAAVDTLARPAATTAFSTIGGSLGTSQRGFRAVANFAGAAANDNTSSSNAFPGADGSTRAIMKAHAEWGSELWAGTGDGDPVSGALGSGGANFDSLFLGLTPFTGGVNGNVHSYTAASGDLCGAGTLAVTLAPISDGWTIRYCPGFSWDDGPGAPGAGNIDIQGIACHEVGHALGLGHSTSPGATMRAVVSGSGVALRSISADDIAGIQSIYGVRTLSKPRITGLEGSTTVGGVLVIRGSKFTANGNEVWFTPAGGSSQPVKAKNLGSSNAGTLLAVVVPDGVTSGQLIVKVSGTGGSSLSNAWPFSVGTGGTTPKVPKLKKDTTVRASLGFGQLEPNTDVIDVTISGNQRWLAFVTDSDVPAPGDSNISHDVFLRDIKKGVTTRISVGANDMESDGSSITPALSNSGRYIVFQSSATNLLDATQPMGQIYRYDRKTEALEIVSQNVEDETADAPCFFPSISANGRFVAYVTRATNLTDDIDTNGESDIFVTDMKKGTTQCASRAFDGSSGDSTSIMPFISGNGKTVVFSSLASNLVEEDVGVTAYSIYQYTLKTGGTELVSRRLDGSPNGLSAFNPSTSKNGRHIAYSSNDPQLVANDTNSVGDVFVVDTKKNITTRASIAPTPDPNLTIQSELNLARAALSANGRYVAFTSLSPDIIPGDPNGVFDVFVFDVKKNTTRVISVTAAGLIGANGESFHAVTSANGRTIAFLSAASDLVGDDTNETADAFVHRW